MKQNGNKVQIPLYRWGLGNESFPLLNTEDKMFKYLQAGNRFVAQSCQGGGLVIPDPGQGCCQSRYDVKQPGKEDSTSLMIILGASVDEFFGYNPDNT